MFQRHTQQGGEYRVSSLLHDSKESGVAARYQRLPERDVRDMVQLQVTRGLNTNVSCHL
jgi:hypothetical protein